MKISPRLRGELKVALVPRIIDGLEALGPVSVCTLEQLIREVLQEIGKALLVGSIEGLDDRYPPRTAPCPCGGQSRYVCRREGVLITVFGRIRYRRAYYICPRCHGGQYPLDQRLGLRPGQVSVALGHLLGLLGVQTAFEEAARLAKELLLVEVSENTVRHETQQYGELQMRREASWQRESHDEERLLERARSRSEPPERLYGGLDGVMIPVGEDWLELKVGCWYKAETAGGLSGHEKRATDISYYCDIGSPDQLRPLMWATGYRREADRAKEIVFIADGAHWIWRLVSYHFPHAVQIVDWYHAVAYLAPIAHGAYGEDTPKATEWIERTRELLWQGQVQTVMAECRRFVGHARAADPAEKALSYYQNNAERMDYARFRAEGYLIGSGVVESACKQIGTQRLKMAGARWSLEGARQTAKARAVWLSDDWASLTETYAELAQAA